MSKREFWIIIASLVVIISAIAFNVLTRSASKGRGVVVINPSSYTASVSSTDNATCIELTFPGGIELKADTNYIVTIPPVEGYK